METLVQVLVAQGYQKPKPGRVRGKRLIPLPCRGLDFSKSTGRVAASRMKTQEDLSRAAVA